jgi:hypothetical protein
MKRLTLVLSVLLWAVLGYSAAVAQDALQSALEYNRTNQASTWVNPDTGVSGTVVPVRTYQNAAGQPCREFQRTIIIGGREERGYGTACRQPDGTWHTVATQRAAAPVERRTTVYVREAPRSYYYPTYRSYPYGYYPYRSYPYGYYAPWGYGYPYWYPFNFSFNFGFLFHSRHH